MRAGRARKGSAMMIGTRRGWVCVGVWAVLVATITLAGCGKHGSPESAAKAWLDALSANQADRAVALIVPSALAKDESMHRMMMTEQAKTISTEKGRFKVIDAHRDGDSATVLVRATNGKKDVDWMPIRVQRERGKWYVQPAMFGGW